MTYAPLSTCTELHLSGKFFSLSLWQSALRSRRLPVKFRCSKRVTWHRQVGEGRVKHFKEPFFKKHYKKPLRNLIYVSYHHSTKESAVAYYYSIISAGLIHHAKYCVTEEDLVRIEKKMKSWGTHPPTGPVKSTLEHRPQLAVDTHTYKQTLFI